MYSYQSEKPKIFTEDGVVLFTAIRDNVQRLLKLSGAVTMGKAISGNCGDSWTMLACVDRLLELGEIQEVTNHDRCRGQDRVFIAKSQP